MNRRAFTFAEMMIVLVMIGIFVGAVIVSMHGRADPQAMEMSAKDLAEALRFAADEAKVSRVNYRVAFTNAHQSFRVEAFDPKTLDFVPSEGRAGIVRLFPSGIYVATISVDGIVQPVLPDSLDFAPEGDGFHGTIELRGAGTQRSSIDVASDTRQVHVSSQ